MNLHLKQTILQLLLLCALVLVAAGIRMAPTLARILF